MSLLEVRLIRRLRSRILVPLLRGWKYFYQEVSPASRDAIRDFHLKKVNNKRKLVKLSSQNKTKLFSISKICKTIHDTSNYCIISLEIKTEKLGINDKFWKGIVKKITKKKS